MRVTQQILFDQALEGVRTHTEAIAKEQAQISSGRRWTRPSEDPTAAAQSLTARTRRSAIEGFTTALTSVRDRVNAGADALQQLSGILSSVKELAISSQNSTLTPGDRAVIAQQLDGALTQIIEIANHRDGFGYLFGGTSTDSPYQRVGNDVQYKGNNSVQEVPIGDALKLATTISGPDVFAKLARGASSFSGGNTGAAPGSGTDSATDRGAVTVIHEVTTYGNALAPAGGDSVSGVRPAATSGAQDTVIGASGAHKLHIDTTQKTITLDGGTAVNYTGTETDLAVTAADGSVVHLDVSHLTSGFNGDVNIAATGSLSTDGGKTKTAINFSANQTIVNGDTKKTTNVDSRKILKAGTETVDYSGTSNLFEAIEGLRDDMLNYDKIPADQRQTSIAGRMREINRNFENVLLSISDLGSRSTIADNAYNRYSTLHDQITSVISNLEDTDMAQTVVQYNQSQLALQLAQTAGSRLLQTNFLSFIQ